MLHVSLLVEEWEVGVELLGPVAPRKTKIIKIPGIISYTTLFTVLFCGWHIGWCSVIISGPALRNHSLLLGRSYGMSRTLTRVSHMQESTPSPYSYYFSDPSANFFLIVYSLQRYFQELLIWSKRVTEQEKVENVPPWPCLNSFNVATEVRTSEAIFGKVCR